MDNAAQTMLYLAELQSSPAPINPPLTLVVEDALPSIVIVQSPCDHDWWGWFFLGLLVTATLCVRMSCAWQRPLQVVAPQAVVAEGKACDP